MNIIDAAHRIASEYPGGAEALAIRMGFKAPAVFRSKVNPNTTTHHLTLIEAMRMMVMTERLDILQAMADELRCMVLPLPNVHQGEDVSTSIADTCGTFGVYLADIKDALTDQRVTPNEAKRLESDLLQMIATASHLQALLAGMSNRHASESKGLDFCPSSPTAAPAPRRVSTI